jgi:hypothetical protein|nr:MAG TPA: hypothetical protein [Caudoviricetes sp.]
MAQIKWTNVNDSGANQALSMYLNAGDRQIGRVQDLLNLGADALGTIESNRVKAEEQARKANADYVINQMNNAQSLEELEALRRNGYADANYLNRAFGTNGINLGDINQAAKTWQQDTVKRAEANDLNKDFSSQGQASIQAIQAAIASGDYTKAQKLIADNRGNISNATFNDLTSAANKGYETDRKYTAEFYPLISQKEAQIAQLDSALKVMDSKDPQFAAVQQQRNQVITEMQKLLSISGMGNTDVSGTNASNGQNQTAQSQTAVQESPKEAEGKTTGTAQSKLANIQVSPVLDSINTALNLQAPTSEYEAQTNNDKFGYNLNNDIRQAEQQQALNIENGLAEINASNTLANDQINANARAAGINLGSVKDSASATKALIEFQNAMGKERDLMTGGAKTTAEADSARANYAGMQKIASTLGLDDPNLSDADKASIILNYAKQKGTNDSLARDAIKEQFTKKGTSTTLIDAITGDGEDIKLNDLYSKAPALNDNDTAWNVLSSYLKREKASWSDSGTKKQVDELLTQAKEAGLTPQETLKYVAYKSNERDDNNLVTFAYGDLSDASTELSRNAKHIKEMKESYKRLSAIQKSEEGNFDFAQAADLKKQFKTNSFVPTSVVEKVKKKGALNDVEEGRYQNVARKLNEAMTELDKMHLNAVTNSAGYTNKHVVYTNSDKRKELAKRFGGMKITAKEYDAYVKGTAALSDEEKKKVPTLYQFNAKLRALGFDPIKIEKPKSK